MSDVAKVKNAYNIVDYIRENGVQLLASGPDTYKGLCPFHNEKTPSFTVNESFQNYKCFGCGERGDVLSFAEHAHSVDFADALKLLAEGKNIELSNIKKEEGGISVSKVREVVLDAYKFYKHNYSKLPESHPAKQEIIKRNLDPSNPLFGYAPEQPNELYQVLKKRGHSDEAIKASELVILYDGNRAPWDFFHSRLLITLSDYLGNPVSFTARKLFESDKMPGKYVNGRESAVFKKKRNLFGADLARKSAREQSEIILVEGQFDRIALAEEGIENVVATSGTSFTDEHANLILRMATENGRAVFIFDGDDAGVKAAMSVFKNASVIHMQSYVVQLDKGKDPCDYIEEKRLDEIKDMVANAKPIADFIVDQLFEKLNDTRSKRLQFVSLAAQAARYATDKAVIDGMLSRISIKSAVPIEQVRDIYAGTKSANTRAVEQVSHDNINPIIVLDNSSAGDTVTLSALAMLIRKPNLLLQHTPKTHRKFTPFLKELRVIAQQKENWTFIEDEYTDKDFAKLLQAHTYPYPSDYDDKLLLNQYLFLMNRGADEYRKESLLQQRASALSSIIDSTDANTIAKALQVHEEA